MILGVVPARGGSRGIAGKNLVQCAGKPLLWYTARAALASTFLERTIVSTDDANIAAAARSFGLDAPFVRPAALANDSAPMLPVLQHALDWAESAGLGTEAVVLLQPTSPLRTAEHIDGAIELFKRASADSVVSVSMVPHRYSPESLYILSEGAIVPLSGGEIPSRRQDKRPLFARNGPAVLVSSASVIRAGSLYGRSTIGYEMSREASVDIDDALDLAFAECLLLQRDTISPSRQ